jgi:anti-sigma regulatory factor (Ser/Thr protein kinase)/putative methionine-R-sulfoxide reductase with GAF domain
VVSKRPPDVGEGQVILGSGHRPIGPPAEHLSALYRISDPVLAELALEPLLEELLVRIRDTLEVDTVAILLVYEEEGVLIPRAAKGLEEEVERRVRIGLGTGFAGRIASARTPIYIADVRKADVVNPVLREKGVRSLLGVPLIAEGELIGVLHVGTLQPREFTEDDAAVLQLAAARAAPAIARARVFEALEREHRAAVALQRSLLPERLPELLDVDIAARYLPARDEVGGDWYDVVPLPGGQIVLAIGDVVGHGARAAALMGEVRAGLRAYALEGHDPGMVLARLDHLLQATHDRGMATAAVARLDPDTGALTIATAGHPPPIVASVSGARLLQVTPAPPLGARSLARYKESTASVAFDETLVMYTDGLVEVRGQSLDAGLERARNAAVGDPDPELVCERIAAAAVPPEGALDDIAMLALRRRPIPDRLELRLPSEAEVLAPMRRSLRRWLLARGAGVNESQAIVLGASEAAANAVEHAYSPSPTFFHVNSTMEGADVVVSVRDSGRWRDPREKGRGRGLGIIRAAMDDVQVLGGGRGTHVVMRKRLAGDADR